MKTGGDTQSAHASMLSTSACLCSDTGTSRLGTGCSNTGVRMVRYNYVGLTFLLTDFVVVIATRKI